MDTISADEFENNTAQDTYYWQLLGLQKDPFSAHADNASYFSLPQWEQYLDLLQHLSRTSNVLLTVVGERGVGKSTLMQQFLLESIQDSYSELASDDTSLAPGEFKVFHEDTLRVCQVSADSRIDATRLLDIITEGFGLPWQSMEILDDQFDAQLENLQQSRQLCLLLIDDAHLLPTETLHYLLYMISQQSDVQMRFHVMLLGETELKDKVDKLVQQHSSGDIACIFELDPFTQEETEQYIQHRLTSSGLTGLSPFTKNDLNHIYKLSKGNPAEINRVAQLVLTNHLTKEPPSAISGWIQQHAAKLLGSVFLVSMLILVAISLTKINSTQSEPSVDSIRVENNPQHEAASQPVAAAKPEVATHSVAPASDENVIHPNADPNNNVAVKEQPNAIPVTDTPKPTIQMQEPSDQSTETMHMNSGTIQPEATSNPNQPRVENKQTAEGIKAVSEETNQLEGSNKVAAPVAPAAEKPVEKMQTVEAKPTAPMVVLKDTSTKKKVNKVKEKEMIIAKLPKVEAPKTLGVAIKAHYFTLQLAALATQEDMNKFINQYNLKNKTQYFKIQNKGKEWYILVYGQYPSSQQAHAAVATLPKELKAIKPWIRSYSSIQQAMRG